MAQDQSDPNRDAELAAEQLRRFCQEQGYSPRQFALLVATHVEPDPVDTAGLPNVPPPKVTRTVADQHPEDYDPSLGRVTAGPPSPEPSTEERERWVAMATDLVLQLGATSAYRLVMPVATPPESELKAARRDVGARLAAALPELEALHRKLCPGWREIVLNWLTRHADKRVEDKYRAAFANRRKTTEGFTRHRNPSAANAEQEGLVNRMPPQTLMTGAELLTQLRRNPKEIMGPIPAWLSAEALDRAAARAGRGRMKGTTTPEVLMQELEAKQI